LPYFVSSPHEPETQPRILKRFFLACASGLYFAHSTEITDVVNSRGHNPLLRPPHYNAALAPPVDSGRMVDVKEPAGVGDREDGLCVVSTETARIRFMTAT
jgi:hypothetical protein